MDADTDVADTLKISRKQVRALLDRYRVTHGKGFKLKQHDPADTAGQLLSKQQATQLLRTGVKRLAALQEKLYAQDRWAMLCVFQAMDAAGKDSSIKHVMSGVNPQGCQVFSFKHPSAEELDHDFLWNAARKLPERGRIGIFNRSYYEEVLILRVHPDLLQAEGLPPDLVDSKTIWRDRYRSIVNLEDHLHRNGTRIVKFFLHLSKEEQRKRFLKRIDTPEKNWKFSLADVEERKYWKEYMRAFEECLGSTSTHTAPWYVVPADDKENAQLVVSRIVLDALKGLKLEYPKLSPERQKELQASRKLLAK